MWEEPDGANHLESMACKMDVLIPAYKIQALAAELKKLRAECGKLIDLAGDWKNAADEYHAERNKLRDENRWIPVTERLPEGNDGDEIGDVLVWRGEADVMPWCDVDDTWEVTHWRPLPKTPEKDK